MRDVSRDVAPECSSKLKPPSHAENELLDLTGGRRIRAGFAVRFVLSRNMTARAMIPHTADESLLALGVKAVAQV